tara:strand:- start:80 stop:265 length:186 start_codon:yes stop_codon:yes gene_type:complete
MVIVTSVLRSGCQGIKGCARSLESGQIRFGYGIELIDARVKLFDPIRGFTHEVGSSRAAPP